MTDLLNYKEAEMADIQTSDSSTDSTETAGQQDSNTDAATDETSDTDQGANQSDTTDDTGTDGDDTANQGQQPDPAKQSLLADLNRERTNRKAAQARVTELEAQVTDLTPVKETLDAVQHRYNRLEEFLTVSGLGAILDSKSFSAALFESDKNIDEIVTEWHRANPSATSKALRTTTVANGGGQKHDPNDLIRIAAGKK